MTVFGDKDMLSNRWRVHPDIVLGEALRSKKFICQRAEASFKVMLYNRFMSV